MGKIMRTLVFLGLILMPTFARAFEFSFPKENQRVTAGSTIKATVDLGETDPPFGVLFVASPGLIASKLDSRARFEWSIKIPPDYYGPLTLWAVVRRYFPIAYSENATVTIFVVRPALRVSLP